jgi:hypothetical protein
MTETASASRKPASASTERYCSGLVLSRISTLGNTCLPNSVLKRCIHRETAMLLCESLEPLVPQGNKGHPSHFNGLLHVDMRQGKHRNPSGWLCHQAGISKRRKAGQGSEKTRLSTARDRCCCIVLEQRPAAHVNVEVAAARASTIRRRWFASRMISIASAGSFKSTSRWEWGLL